MWLSCDCHVTLQISQALSQELLLLPSDGRLGPAHTEKSIRELTILSYRLETLYQGLGAELVGRVKIARLAANAMQLLLAVQLDVDTEQRFVHIIVQKLLTCKALRISMGKTSLCLGVVY